MRSEVPVVEYRCRVHLIPDDESGFTAYSATLPGVVSEGETEAEALANVAEAFEGTIRSYRSHGERIPWLDVPRQPEPAELVRFVVVAA